MESPILVDPVLLQPALKIAILMAQRNPVKLPDGGLAHAEREADLATGYHMRG